MTDDIQKIGKYTIQSELGRGAMGVVYKGLDPIINRYVAIKTISRYGNDAENSALAARFKQEAQAAGGLNHPGIVSVYEYGEDGDISFIAMELVEGHTLAELSKQQIQLGVEETANLIIKVLEALHYAHTRGVVHRDIKPSNIMRTPDGDVKIADFGIARIESSELTQLGTVIGTPGYMSPEQLLGQHVDYRSDIFSCGILLYELLTGESAFSATNITSTMYKVVHTELPPASKICPTVPAAFDTILARALAKQPDDRFVSAEQFAQAIKAIHRAEQVPPSAGFAAGPESDPTVIQPRTAPGTAPPPPQTAANAAYEPPPPSPQPTSEEDPLEMFLSTPTVDEGGESTLAGVSMLPGRRRQDARAPVSRSKQGRPFIFAAGVAAVAAAGISALLWLRGLDDAGPGRLPADRTAPSSDTSQQAKAPPAAVPGPATPAYRAGERIKDCATCPDMIVVPPGSFTQGSPASEAGRQANEGPQRTVRVNYPLAVAEHEVSLDEFAQFVSETGHTSPGCTTYEGDWRQRQDRDWRSPGFYQNESEAVTCVSWNDAREYADWLSQKTGKPYRLLSASEWEYVARAGAPTARSWGDDPDAACKLTNVADRTTRDDYPGWKIHDCMDGHLYTAPPDALRPNDFGVYAMLGNLFEWVEDCWNEDYQDAPADGSAWTEGDCSKRSLRGGSWYSQPQFVRSAFRNRFQPDARASTFGIRVARELPSG